MIIFLFIYIAVGKAERNLMVASLILSTLSLCLSITVSVILSHKLLKSPDSTNDNDTCSESIPEATPTPTKGNLKVFSVYDSDPEVVGNSSSEESR